MSSPHTVLITGSTDGVGRRFAETLASPGVQILVHGRNVVRGRSVVAAIERAGGSAQFFEADLGSMAGVRRLAQEVQAEHAQLDALVNNAGIAKPGRARRESPDGFELHMAVNYLAPFLLTRLLGPTLGARKPSRIVNVVSAAQSAIDFSDLMLAKNYDGNRAYAQSKLAQVMLTFDLAAKYTGTDVTANCIHPGTHLNTTMVREAGITPVGSVDVAADALRWLVTSEDVAGTTGCYFDGRRESRAHPQAYDTEPRRRLRAATARLMHDE